MFEIRPKPLRRSRTADERENSISEYISDYCDRTGGAVAYAAGRPARSASVIVDALRLPVLEASISAGTAEGALIDHALAQRHTLRRFFPVASVLELPAEPDQFSAGPHRQTLRRMVRKARQAGIVCTAVIDPAEQQQLITAADDWERISPRPLYRDADASNVDCLDYRLWHVAWSRDGRPLALAVTPVDGRWGLLRYFRTIGVGKEQSLARYLLLQALAEQLVADGIRYLADETSPLRLPNGLRHYQRMVGFRLRRIRMRRAAGAGTVSNTRPARTGGPPAIGE